MDIQTQTMLDAELTEKVQHVAVNFLVEDLYHGVARSNIQCQILLLKLSTLLLEAAVLRSYV